MSLDKDPWKFVLIKIERVETSEKKDGRRYIRSTFIIVSPLDQNKTRPQNFQT